MCNEGVTGKHRLSLQSQRIWATQGYILRIVWSCKREAVLYTSFLEKATTSTSPCSRTQENLACISWKFWQPPSRKQSPAKGSLQKQVELGMKVDGTAESHELPHWPRTLLYTVQCIALESEGQQMCPEKMGWMVVLAALCHTVKDRGQAVPFFSSLMSCQ